MILKGALLTYFRSERDVQFPPRGRVDLRGACVELEGLKRRRHWTFHVVDKQVRHRGVALRVCMKVQYGCACMTVAGLNSTNVSGGGWSLAWRLRQEQASATTALESMGSGEASVVCCCCLHYSQWLLLTWLPCCCCASYPRQGVSLIRLSTEVQSDFNAWIEALEQAGCTIKVMLYCCKQLQPM